MEKRKDSTSIIQPYFAFESSMPAEYKNDRYCVDRKSRFWQQSDLFARDNNVRKHINKLRAKIDTEKVRKKFKQFRIISLKADNAFVKAINQGKTTFDACADPMFIKLKKKRDKILANLRRNIDKKVTVNDIRDLLKRHKKPFSWEQSLSYYILTGKIMSSNVHCEICIKDNKVMIRLSPQASAKEDYRKLYRRAEALHDLLDKNQINVKVKKPTKIYLTKDSVIVEILPCWIPNAKEFNKLYKEIPQKQQFLRQRTERMKPKLDRHIKYAARYKRYRNKKHKTPENRQDEKLELVDDFSNKRAYSKKAQRKAEGNLRQIFRRHSRYV